MESESKEIGEREKIKRRGEELKNREKKGSDGEWKKVDNSGE